MQNILFHSCFHSTYDCVSMWKISKGAIMNNNIIKILKISNQSIHQEEECSIMYCIGVCFSPLIFYIGKSSLDKLSLCESYGQRIRSDNRVIISIMRRRAPSVCKSDINFDLSLNNLRRKPIMPKKTKSSCDSRT